MAKATTARKPAAARGMPTGTIHRSIHFLQTALDELGASMPLSRVEQLAVMINQAMTAQARSFHTPEHVFDLVDPGNPHMTLAALFHDIVYYNVDHGFIPQIEEAVQSSIELERADVRLRQGTDPGSDGAAHSDRQLELCLAVFGFERGQKLSPFGGMNEFLSALVMNRALGGAVREEDLLLATACVEATIPFRKTPPGDPSPAEQLARRLAVAAAKLGLEVPQNRIEQSVAWAVTFANRDVANFGEKEVTKFLDNTWKLLPESNPTLRTQRVYSIRSYRVALQKMEGFLQSLDPDTIFASYHGSPPAEEHRRMRQRAERNITTARDYLGIKLLTTAVLEALAEISGGDAPVSLFMGEIDARQKGSRLEDYLPDHEPPAGVRVDKTLRDLLAFGRASVSSFDLQNSPLSLFIYQHLGADGFRDHLGAARHMFDGKLPARELLDALPTGMTAAIAEGCAAMAFTRAEELLSYAASRRAGA